MRMRVEAKIGLQNDNIEKRFEKWRNICKDLENFKLLIY